MDTKSLLRTDKFYIIDTRTNSCPKGRHVEIRDLEACKDYSELTKAQKEFRLAEKIGHLPPHIAQAANNVHTMKMLEDPACKVEEECDEDGLIYIRKDVKMVLEDKELAGEEVVKHWLKVLQTVDREIQLSKYGLQFGEVVETKPTVKK